jgi:GNT-I family
MEISVDFYDYFRSLYPTLKADPSLYCVSSWNDNGMTENVHDPKAVHRTDVFPGMKEEEEEESGSEGESESERVSGRVTQNRIRIDDDKDSLERNWWQMA